MDALNGIDHPDTLRRLHFSHRQPVPTPALAHLKTWALGIGHWASSDWALAISHRTFTGTLLPYPMRVSPIPLGGETRFL
ncbi:MAG: hypothetical protein KME26_08215 [Oscillatoria princeps RMCB-10]|jgi:hypothetical protein|nr:hypothetical protein [Oscillatoria princeps RMCB-10]